MPFSCDSLSTQSRQEFCGALRAARERKQITLTQIAQSTKIPAYMFAALERGDLRRWPKGLFRRSFFRDYAGMIGVPVAETCAEFVRLFPDNEGAAATKAGAVSEDTQTTEIRLVLDTSWHGPRSSIRSRLLAALIDTAVIVLVSVVLDWGTILNWTATTTIVALAYFSLATVAIGESPAKWVLARRGSIVDALTHGSEAVAAWSRGAGAISHVFRRADDGTPEPVEEPEMSTWITDAHGVGSAASQQLRVRVKVS